jgi:hypothetical protein
MATSPDLHVVSLQYALKTTDHCSYANAPALEFETGEARFRLVDGELICEMKTHYPTADAARAGVEPILRAWEVDVDLRSGRGELRFAFEGADIVDRTPKPAGTIHGTAYIVSPPAMVSACGTVSVDVTRDQYPDPPSSFRLNPDVQSLLDRYYRYLDGGEPLLGMAYFCLTLVEVKTGGKTRRERHQRASAKYRMETTVFEKMGTLTSERGDRQSARKASAAQPLMASESAWVQAALKKLIRQLGTPEVARSWITMADLPAI